MILLEWIAFYSMFLNIHLSGVLTLRWYTGMAGATWNCCSFGTFCVYHAPCHFIQSHIHKVHTCLAVMCHLPFWQNDLDLLHATAVKGGGGGGWIPKYESAQKIAPGDEHSSAWTMQGFKPLTFQSSVRHSNHWLTELSSLTTTTPATLMQTSSRLITQQLHCEIHRSILNKPHPLWETC